MSVFTPNDSRFSRRAALRGSLPFLAIASGSACIAGATVGPALAAGAGQATPDALPEVAFPDTAIGREFASLIDAVNSRDPDLLLVHFETYFPAEMAEGMAANTLLNTLTMGSLVVHRIEEATETSITAFIETTLSEEWLDITLSKESEISEIGLSPATPLPDVFPDQPLDDNALANEMAAYFERLAEADVFSGAVLVARNGTPIFAEAYGLADTDLGLVNTLDTRFNYRRPVNWISTTQSPSTCPAILPMSPSRSRSIIS
jgi:hypothetical protein